ncbi:hypothetical protein JTB14_001436 [Gonioctena quinquepunctata]|nr:hypothetical protein JTB14_001436 [Gonioctena quinquepunctata]
MEELAYKTEGNQERHKTMEKYPHQRKHQVMITRLLTGHTKYTHKHLLTGGEEKKFDMCQVPVSVEHFLSDCLEFVKQRQDYEIYTDLKVALGVNCNVLRLKVFLQKSVYSTNCEHPYCQNTHVHAL